MWPFNETASQRITRKLSEASRGNFRLVREALAEAQAESNGVMDEDDVVRRINEKRIALEENKLMGHYDEQYDTWHAEALERSARFEMQQQKLNPTLTVRDHFAMHCPENWLKEVAPKTVGATRDAMIKRGIIPASRKNLTLDAYTQADMMKLDIALRWEYADMMMAQREKTYE